MQKNSRMKGNASECKMRRKMFVVITRIGTNRTHYWQSNWVIQLPRSLLFKIVFTFCVHLVGWMLRWSHSLRRLFEVQWRAIQSENRLLWCVQCTPKCRLVQAEISLLTIGLLVLLSRQIASGMGVRVRLERQQMQNIWIPYYGRSLRVQYVAIYNVYNV